MGLEKVRITALLDNAEGPAGLRARWGLSLWIETPRARVLLDCGDRSDAFLRNAERLGIAVETADAFVLSHGHYDHGGGLGTLAVCAPSVPLVAHPASVSPRYSLRRSGKADPIGLPASGLAALRAANRTVWASAPQEVAPDVWATGPVPRRRPLETAERTFFLDPACTIPDHVVDDQAVWVETPAGLVVLLGCAHSGVVNTLHHIRETIARFRQQEAADGQGGKTKPPTAADGLPAVRALIGGMHLLHAGPDRLRATADFLETLELECCAPCHCTGKRATALLRERLPDAFVDIATGSEVTLPYAGGQA